ncbi:aerobic carbon monoxide dehydrogenase, CoxF accessory protein [Burkholderiales bacterium]|nr:aerobic carbon monoxide dehydrogenase, CoxF accessory protein [Burkholderiales bacterium]
MQATTDERGVAPGPGPATAGELLQLAQELLRRGEAYAMVTVVRAVAPSSAFAGAQALVRSDGSLHGWIGGGCAKQVVIQAALEAIGVGAPRLVRIGNESEVLATDVESHPMPCASNGTIELFIHPFPDAPLLQVLGSTPVAACARVFAQQLGLRVSSQTQGIHPQVALVATQGEGDEPALEAALAGTAQRVLMIASARKAQRLRETLRQRGVSEEAALEAPAGPDIGARTPAEIALAAVAGVVAWWRTAGRQAVPARPQATPAAAPGATTAVDPVCGMLVDPAHSQHSLEYEGVRWHFCCAGCQAAFAREPARYAASRASARHAA